MADFGQLVEYKTVDGILNVPLEVHSLDVLPTLAAVQGDYAHVAAEFGRVPTLDAAALSAVQVGAAAVYDTDVIEHEITSNDPAVIIENLITVRNHPEWHVGLNAVADVTTVFYAGTLWVCRVSHVVTNDPNWRPDVAPNLWRRFYDPANPEWSYPTAYTVGNVVMYNGASYRCLQSHTSNSAWYPSAVGVINVLWVAV